MLWLVRQAEENHVAAGADCTQGRMRAGTLLAFNTETKGVQNDPSSRETAESRIALATDRLCEALAKPARN